MLRIAAIVLCLTTALWSQPSDIERRVAELEEKMRLIDPAFGKGASAQDLLARIDQLEKKLNGVLALNKVEPAPLALQPPAQPTAALAPAPAPTQVAVL